MIPSQSSILNQDIQIKELPSKNFRMEWEGNHIRGYVDGAEAMKQVIYMILNTERYQYIIYSWNYGVELLDLFGEPVTYVCPELERRIREALLQDDRITGVDSFEFDIKGTEIRTWFMVHTKFGNFQGEKAVKI